MSWYSTLYTAGGTHHQLQISLGTFQIVRGLLKDENHLNYALNYNFSYKKIPFYIKMSFTF